METDIKMEQDFDQMIHDIQSPDCLCLFRYLIVLFLFVGVYNFTV